jgi:hypothetical protein
MSMKRLSVRASIGPAGRAAGAARPAGQVDAVDRFGLDAPSGVVEAEVRRDRERAAHLVDRAQPRGGVREEVERAQQVDVGSAEEAHHRPADEAHVVVQG